MKDIELKVLVSPGCHTCHAFEEFWRSVEKDWLHVTFIKVDVTSPEGQELAQTHMIFASPGIILNGTLFATGGFDREKFLAELKKLSS